MDRKNFLLKRRLQYMGILFVVFLLLFSIFDLIVYSISASAFRSKAPDATFRANSKIYDALR